MAVIRSATVDDAAAVQAIYAPYVSSTAISFELEPPTVDEMRERIAKTLARLPWLICEDVTGAVMGYAYASPHRERPAYQWSVDVSAYVAPEYQRCGVGRGLYTALFGLLRWQGYYNAFAGIALPNAASVGLHQAMGFQAVGVYHEVGYKLNRWHDVSWWGLSLQPKADFPAAPQGISIHHPDWQAAVEAGLPYIRGG